MPPKTRFYLFNYSKTFQEGEAELAIYLLTQPDSDRIDPIMKEYGEALHKDPAFLFKFVEAPSNCSIDSLTISNDLRKLKKKSVIWKSHVENKKQSADMAAALIEACRDFLKTSIPWFYRGTDDTLINITNLKSYLGELKKFNPFTQPLVFGNCISHWGTHFLQGGSGYLMSRFAVEQFMSHSKSFLLTLNYPEDVYFSMFIKTIGFNLKTMSSPKFSGHYWREKIQDRFDHPETLTECKHQYEFQCGSIIGKPQEIVFFHQMKRTFNDSVETAHLLWNAPPLIHMHNLQTFPELCLIKK